MTDRNPLILASASPRRRHLMAAAGYAFEVDPSHYREPEYDGSQTPAAFASELAWRKALDVARRRERGLILGADTLCDLDGMVLGKPADREDAERMVRVQEGRDVRVITGLCLCRAGGAEWTGGFEVSVVRFRRLTDAERREHLDSRRWEGKAGAYGVQDHDPFVTVVRGSWSNVVGLPMERLAALLASTAGSVP